MLSCGQSFVFVHFTELAEHKWSFKKKNDNEIAVVTEEDFRHTEMCNTLKYRCFVPYLICIMLISATCWLQGQRQAKYQKEFPRNGLYKRPDQNELSLPYSGPFAEVGDIPKVYIKEANCKALFKGNIGSSSFAFLNEEYWHSSEEQLIEMTNDCNTYIKTRKYIMKPVSSEEANFPLAFTLSVYTHAGQVEQLLRAIYRPQNYYCIHVDLKAVDLVYQSLSKITGCFGNVFLASKRYHVIWGMFSVLQPELQCMEDLLKRKGWRYLINLTGQEFPLKTNEDIVKILKVYNGSNAIDFNMW